MVPRVYASIWNDEKRGRIYRLEKELIYCGIEVPVGFECDGASVPRIFWSTVFPPGDEKALFAAIIHDFLYRTHPVGWTKKLADETFHELLIRGGVSKWRAWKAYIAVKLFCGSAWRDGGKYNG